MTRMVFHPLILSSGIQKFHTKALQKYNKFMNTFVYENIVFVVILDSISIKMLSNFSTKVSHIELNLFIPPSYLYY